MFVTDAYLEVGRKRLREPGLQSSTGIFGEASITSAAGLVVPHIENAVVNPYCIEPAGADPDRAAATAESDDLDLVAERGSARWTAPGVLCQTRGDSRDVVAAVVSRSWRHDRSVVVTT